MTSAAAPSSRRRQHRLRLVALGCGLAVSVGAAVMLLGWVLNEASLKTLGPDNDSMRVQTVVTVLAAGLLLTVAARSEALRVGAALAAVVSLVPLLTLVAYATGTSFGIDVLFGAEARKDLGLMSPLSAAALFALAVALVATFLGRVILAQTAAAVVLLIALTVWVGYVFGVESLYQVQDFTSMKANTAIAVGVAAGGVMALNTSAGILSILVGGTAGGVVGRALLPPIVGLQVLATGVVLYGVNEGNYSYRLGFALVALVNVLGGILLTLVLAYVLRTSDLRRAALEVAQEQSAELAAANAVLEDFAAMAAHDLRGPLAAVTGYAELLQDELAEGGADGTSAELLTRIQDAARRGDEMITELLTFARLGTDPLEVEEVDLEDEVREVAVEVSELLGRPLEVVTAHLPVVAADRALLRLLLTNVLGNAVKYVPSDRPCRVIVDGKTDEGFVVVGFTDNGDGIAQHDRDRLLKMFQRGPGAQSVPGTGIGLATCARVAECHGGRFWIADAPDKGTCFRLALPAPARHPAARS